MNTRTNVSPSKRTLFLDFDLYTDNDPEFKQELIASMIDNLNELQEAYDVSVEQKDPVFFSKACHKVKTTLVMLEDPELNAVVEDLKKSPTDPGLVSHFENIIAEIIASLLGVK